MEWCFQRVLEPEGQGKYGLSIVGSEVWIWDFFFFFRNTPVCVMSYLRDGTEV
jgi:hypothetical protein